MNNEMNSPRAVARLSAMLLAVVVLATGCGPGSPESSDDTMLGQYAPKDTQSIIKAVSLGASDSESFDPQRVGTEFTEGVNHVVARYRWDGADAKDTITLHWFLGDEMILEQGEAVGKPAGTEAWFLKKPEGPLPAGNYKVEFLVNDAVVTTIPFRIAATQLPIATASTGVRSLHPGGAGTEFLVDPS